jgi:hypothetical protein
MAEDEALLEVAPWPQKPHGDFVKLNITPSEKSLKP